MRGRTPRAGGFFAALGPRSPSPAPSVPVPLAGRVAIRNACEADLPEIAAIWAHEVLGSDATTDTEPRTPTAQREWLARHPECYPVIVAVTDYEVVAYGSLSPYQLKPAFARTVEDSVYVRRDRRGSGLGTMILNELIQRARARGHHSILARITAKNTASLHLHARHGFRPIGLERESAFKLGRWHDITIMQCPLDTKLRDATEKRRTTR